MFICSSSVLHACQQMKDLNHENINTFIGIANDLTGVTVLWAYCPKGSLFDILRNDDIKLDFNFAISFAEDIAQVANIILPFLLTLLISFLSLLSKLAPSSSSI